LQAARLAGAEETLVLGGLGMRWDQTVANLMLAASQPGLRVRLEDGNQEFDFLEGAGSLELSGQAGDTVSLIPLAAGAAGITTEGLEYPLRGESLPFGTSRGVSNRMLAERAVVTIKQGLLLCVHTRREAAEE
jgi:thiamine pyrophosphokinase